MSLEKQFDQAMLSIHRRAKDEARYSASAFFQMLQSHGGVETARRLVNSSAASNGYTELYLRGRLDLTVEATIIDEPKWWPLFTEDDLARARKRLKDYGYKV